MKLVTTREMQNLDRTAIEDYNIPSITLMENAGHGTVEAIIERYGNPDNKIISIFVGPGNNGGDGLVIARHLLQLNAKPVVFLLTETEKFKDDAEINLKIVQRLPLQIISILNKDDLDLCSLQVADSWIILDAIVGTGLTREITGHFDTVIQYINEQQRPVVAVDIPSGLNADSGQPMGNCIDADYTVTFGLAKTGQVCYPGRNYIGLLQVIDISIPDEAIVKAEIKRIQLTCEIGRIIPKRSLTAHKGTFGHLLIVAGSMGKTGAAILSALGALRCGTGLVSLCVPLALNSIFEQSLYEAMTIPCKSSENFLSVEDLQDIKDAIVGKKAMVIGPGIGQADKTSDLVIKLYQEISIPMVVDADGLNILAANPENLKDPAGPRILTPHPGEMSRLTGQTITDIQSDRIRVAETFARENGIIVILKGADTVVAAPDGYTAINSSGNPGMAAGGMGDVLSGVIGGFLTQGLSPWEASCLGVFVHGLAGDRIVSKKNGVDFGYLASDLAAEIPAALCEIRDYC